MIKGRFSYGRALIVGRFPGLILKICRALNGLEALIWYGLPQSNSVAFNYRALRTFILCVMVVFLDLAHKPNAVTYPIITR